MTSPANCRWSRLPSLGSAPRKRCSWAWLRLSYLGPKGLRRCCSACAGTRSASKWLKLRGLVQAVKSLGKTLRTFQPTIRELASVSNELKNTLTEQIGLDEIRNEFRQGATGAPRDNFLADTAMRTEQSGAEAASSSHAEPVAMLEPDPDIERKRAESKQAAWGVQESPKAGLKMEELSLQELEAELERRRQAAQAASDA